MVDYRDIGHFDDGTTAQVEVTEAHNQVYKATHEGEARLPFCDRAFISFSYGGKNIEDFDLLSTIDGDRLTRQAYAEFNDNITESDVMDGQMYWSTHYNAYIISFTLSTDDLEQEKLDEFKHWFKPGVMRELILAEHPNRAILARVAETPEYNVNPFEKKVKRKIAGEEYEVTVAQYKGDISISFISDDPFWYSLTNVLDMNPDTCKYMIVTDGAEPTPATLGPAWRGVDNDWGGLIINNSTKKMTKDAMKIITEDGVPYSEMLDDSDANYRLSENLISGMNLLQSQKAGTMVTGKTTTSGTSVNQNRYIYLPRVQTITTEDEIDYVIDWSDTGIISQNSGDTLCFYYAGTAPTKPILTFAVTPIVDSETGRITSPYNRYAKKKVAIQKDQYYETTSSINISDGIVTGLNNLEYVLTEGPAYNTIVFETNGVKKEFKFTLPGVWYAYNQVIDILHRDWSNEDWEKLRATIRDEVKHWAPRAYAIYLIQNIKKIQVLNDATISNLAPIYKYMPNFLKDLDSSGYGDYNEMTFSFDSSTGKAIGTVRYIIINNGSPEVKNFREDIGDCVRSEYLILDERNRFDENGKITTANCSYIYTDLLPASPGAKSTKPYSMNAVDLTYKNMYL